MLNQSVSPEFPVPRPWARFCRRFPFVAATSRHRPAAIPDRAALDALLDGEDAPSDGAGRHRLLHWRLLREVSHLADPATPLEESSTPCAGCSANAKDGLPFSFVSCLRVVGCSPLSPIAYCGLVDAEGRCATASAQPEGLVRCHARALPRLGVRRRRPQPRMGRGPARQEPQWINEQIKRMAVQGDLFA